MKNNKSKGTITTFTRGIDKRIGLRSIALLLIGSICCTAKAQSSYRQVNLVSDQPGVALLQDTNLVNAWGISFSATSPFWISDNGTGKATLYAVTNDVTGTVHVAKQGLTV